MSGAPFRLVAVGVGGQGVVTIARLLGQAALKSGLSAMVGELHGMSQRGGSVRTSVVIGDVRTSFVGPGRADVVLAMEPLEALRARPWMSERTHVLVHLFRIPPAPLSGQGLEYPPLDGILAKLREAAGQVSTVDGEAMARTLGSIQPLNIGMLGALASLGLAPVSAEALLAALEERVSARYLRANQRAFALGQEGVVQ